MAQLTKENVKAMLGNDTLCVPCASAAELTSVYQTAFNAKKELGKEGERIKLSKSNITMTVVIRTFT